MWPPLPRHTYNIYFHLNLLKLPTTTICKIYLPVNKEFTTVKLCFLSSPICLFSLKGHHWTIYLRYFVADPKARTAARALSKPDSKAKINFSCLCVVSNLNFLGDGTYHFSLFSKHTRAFPWVSSSFRGLLRTVKESSSQYL